MLLGELARLFPPEPAAWDGAASTRVFPYDLRARFRVRLAGHFAAADRARPRAAARLGISTRAYEPGDAFKDFSLPHFARLGEYHTRIDNAPGRAQGAVVAHFYSNMAFASTGAQANKGQVALAIAVLLETAHHGALHGFRLFPCFEPDLSAFLAARERALSRARWLWVITDGLFDPRSEDGGLGALAAQLAPRPALKTNLILVRDAFELPGSDHRNSLPSARLAPWMPQSDTQNSASSPHFSGEGYELALARQLDALAIGAARSGFGRCIAHAAMPVEAAASAIEFLV